MLATNDKVSAT